MSSLPRGHGRPRVTSTPFKALQHRNFRLLWIGQLVSMAGSMMQNAAILWHVSLLVEPANRGLALGMVGLVRVVPIVTFSLVAGVIADARDRRRLMLFTQTGMAMSAALLSWVAFAGVKSVWPIFFQGGPQLGELEAGLVANAWGPVLSVVSGGVGCLLITGLIASRTPQLRQYRASVHLRPADEVREGGLS